MNAIPNSVIPPRNGLDKEEPELAYEDDIPSDDESPAQDGDIERE
ncbi:hypothetical protein ACFPOE_11050 [Caenimonas terrae]|uniref:Uncharacterized protein n=1 Tax=Caenimonas terrae TaxID=696074 RepID=A0ABW0NDL5_9BURK